MQLPARLKLFFLRTELGLSLIPRWFRAVALLVLAAALYSYSLWVFPNVERVRPANVGAQSASVGWVTTRPSRGCVVALGGGFDIRRVCDRGAKKIAHLVEMTDLTPETRYRLFLFDGVRVTFLRVPSVTTQAEAQELPTLPRPAYGSVVDEAGRPVVGAMVYLSAVGGDFRYPIAAKTNIEGNYAFDLGMLFGASERFLIEAVGQLPIWAERDVSGELYAPLPSLIVKAL